MEVLSIDDVSLGRRNPRLSRYVLVVASKNRAFLKSVSRVLFKAIYFFDTGRFPQGPEVE